jgi:protein TonB
MIAIGTRTQSSVRHGRIAPSMALSIAVHVLALAAWLVAPQPTHSSADASVFAVQLVAAPPPAPEPEPEPAPQPQPPAPQPPQPAPRPLPAPTKVIPAKPAAAPARQTLASTAPVAAVGAAQPVSTATAAEVNTAEAGEAVAVPAPSARAADSDDYVRMVWARIMRFRPDRVRFAGSVRLRFSLDTDGGVTTVEVVESSGSALLDRTALDAVQRAAPFPPPPGSAVPRTPFEIPFHFVKG